MEKKLKNKIKEITEHQSLFTQQGLRYMMIFISAVLAWSSEKDSTNTCIMPTTDQIIMNSQLTYTNTNTTLARERIMRR